MSIRFSCPLRCKLPQRQSREYAPVVDTQYRHRSEPTENLQSGFQYTIKYGKQYRLDRFETFSSSIKILDVLQASGLLIRLNLI